MRIVIAAFLVFVSCFNFGCMLTTRGQRYQDFRTPAPLSMEDTLILGFIGGREDWNNEREGVRRLALKLESLNLPHCYVETVENKRRSLALHLIQEAFDRNGNKVLDSGETQSVRLIVYGQSFGGAAVVKFARELQKWNVPLLLTVQIDSVGRNDAAIPSNVKYAANLFQRNGTFIQGEPKIYAEDRSAELVVLDDALKRLAEFDPQKSRIVEMKFFGGLTNEEIAEVEQVSKRTVIREWRKAKAWLFDEIHQ